RLGRPDVAFALPPALAGVSGLTPLGPDRLGAVQDGDGVLFVLDPRTGTIVSRHPFGNSGDYVGVEAVGDTVWVLQDNGTLHEIAGATGAGPARRQHATPLRSRCDPEGLGYEPASHRLLIACKAEAGPELAGVRVIYAFDLRKKRLSGRPAILFDRRPLDAHGTSFKPSALAVHPRTEQIYVLSAGRRERRPLPPRPPPSTPTAPRSSPPPSPSTPGRSRSTCSPPAGGRSPSSTPTAGSRRPSLSPRAATPGLRGWPSSPTAPSSSPTKATAASPPSSA